MTAAKRTTAARAKSKGFTSEELSAMKDRVRELKSEKPDGETEVLAKIAEMEPADRILAERIHAIVRRVAPALGPKLWYGMPAYARDGDIVCFFRPAQKFKTRYATLGFSDEAKLDEGGMWPTDFAVKHLTGAEEARVVALVKRAVG